MSNNNKKDWFSIAAWAVFIVLCALWLMRADAHPATHAECAAYWTNRTITWNNPPSAGQIHNDDLYCGGLL